MTTLRTTLRIACPIAAVVAIGLGLAALTQHSLGLFAINAFLACINVHLTIVNWSEP